MPTFIPTPLQRRKPELMSPAGDRICLRAALQAGADAVYFGIGSFNMRANAGNFSLRELDEVVRIIHENGVKAYLTLNTVILPGDMGTLQRVLAAAARSQVDAVIAWDLAVIVAAREAGLEVFLSTQASVANASALLYYYRHLGIRRFVLARECSLGNIRSIRRAIFQELGDQAADIEIEVFAHGAMCLSVSGRCQLSQFQSGASANRGACRQPCRHTYTITEALDGSQFEVGDHFILSPSDICTLPFLEKLLNAGVDSLKIEGRQRSAEYVFAVTGAYRRILDLWYETPRGDDFNRRFAAARETEMVSLEKVFNRGFSSGFYLGKPLAEWNRGNGTQATHRKQTVGEVVNYYRKPAVAAVRLDASGIAVGDEIMIHGPTTGVKQTIVVSIEEEFRRVSCAPKGKTVGINFPEPVRRGDQVYRLIPVSKETTATPHPGLPPEQTTPD
jgi:putative protease